MTSQEYSDLLKYIKDKSSQNNLEIISKVRSHYDIVYDSVYKIEIIYYTYNYFSKTNNGKCSRREVKGQIFDNCNISDIINWVDKLLESKEEQL